MAGKKTDQTTLNATLLFIARLLNKHNITDWFVAYGTLLGIVRNDSCIDGDDDIDIVVDRVHYDAIKRILLENGFEMHGIRSRSILKTRQTEQYGSVDFYMATSDKKGNFNDTWEKVTWSNCYNDANELVEYMWNDETLYLPNNYTQKLVRRYGESWKTPQKSKGVRPRKKIL